jgi:hypothetical protein
VANLVSALALRSTEQNCFSVASIIRFVTLGEEGESRLRTLLVDILLVRIERGLEISIVAVH